jgi:hypothetical protein
VLRWLVSFIGSPGRGVESQAGLLAAAVPAAAVVESVEVDPVASVPVPPVARIPGEQQLQF